MKQHRKYSRLVEKRQRGSLVLGLGCENNGVDEFKKVLEYNPQRVKFSSVKMWKMKWKRA